MAADSILYYQKLLCVFFSYIRAHYIGNNLQLYSFSNLAWKSKYVLFLQKSSVPSLALPPPPPCVCFNTGFQECMLNPSGFCDCSAGCSFVMNYLQDQEQGYDKTEMVSMRTFSGLMTPDGDSGGKFSPSELQNTLEVSSQFETLLFQANMFPILGGFW